MKYHRIVVLLTVITSCVYAANGATDDYFHSLTLIKQPPPDAIAIPALSDEEAQTILKQIKIEFFDTVKVYRGDFTNEGLTEYAVVTEGGTMHTNTVTIYKMLQGKLIDLNVDKIITTQLLAGADMSQFYYHTSDPFAVIRHGKTYLRFMDYPGGSREYDKTQLKLCTYLITGSRIRLTGPNWTFKTKTGPMVPAANCISE